MMNVHEYFSLLCGCYFYFCAGVTSMCVRYVSGYNMYWDVIYERVHVCVGVISIWLWHLRGCDIWYLCERDNKVIVMYELVWYLCECNIFVNGIVISVLVDICDIDIWVCVWYLWGCVNSMYNIIILLVQNQC